MKTLLRFLLVNAIIGISLIAYCQTPVYGPSASGRWTIDGSPYQIMDNITVPADSTLTIYAGVEIIFHGHYGISISGCIEALGSESDSIIFTALDTLTGWNGMLFNIGTNVSKFDYCIFEHSHCDQSNGGGGAICSYMTEMQLNHCSFRNNSLVPTCVTPYGGAVVVYFSQDLVVIKDCCFKNNVCPVSGGALLCWSSSPTIENCTFFGNTAGYGGGALATYSGAHPVVKNCEFINNTSNGGSGAIGILQLCNPEIIDCLIKNNSAVESAGGIGVDDQCTPIIRNCIIRGNTAQQTSGGIGLSYSGGVIEQCIIDSNMAVGRGGGIGCGPNTTTLISSCQITNNNSSGRGGGIAITSCNPEIRNNTIAYNQAGVGGGIGFDTYLATIVENTILWQNSAQDGDQVYLESGNNPGFTYCDIEGNVNAFGGPGAVNYSGTYADNIDLDPMFVDVVEGDYRICWISYPVIDLTRSPCIDEGNPTPLFNDPDGTQNDIGAYYFNQMPETPEAYYPPSYTLTGFMADWSSCCGALGFILDVATDTAFTSYVPGYENLEINDTTSWYDVTGLEPGHDYYYRVKTSNTACTSEYSNIVTFYLPPPPSVTELEVYPFKLYSSGNELYLQTTGSINTESYLFIYNSAGQLLFSKSITTGTNHIPVNVSKQVVFIKIIINGELYQMKVLVK